MPIPSDAKDFARPLCINLNVDWPTYEKQIQQESSWAHYDSQGNVKTSPGGAKGLGQIVPTSHPTANWADPYENLKYSINLMAAHLRRFNNSYKHALAAYNWGPGNVGGYTKDGLVHPAWDGTRSWRCPQQDKVKYCNVSQMHTYLDKILGPNWTEPSGVPAPMPDVFSVGQGIRALMAEYGDVPATDELYYKNDRGENQYSEAFGQSGSSYVYLFSLNRVFRFQAD